jgi:hypothetical protein
VFPRNCATGSPNGIGKSIRRPGSSWHRIRNWLVGTWPASARTWLRRTERGNSRTFHRQRSRHLWANQVSETEQAAISALKHGAPLKPDESKAGDALAAVTWAEEHLFDRRSVVLEHELWRHALEHARGQNITLKPFDNHARSGLHPRRRWPVSNHDPGCFGTRMGHRVPGEGRERAVRPFHNHFSSSNVALDQDQRQAAEHILVRATSSRCFAAAPAPERALRCGRCGMAFGQPGIPCKPSRRNASKSLTWSETE